MAYDNREIEIKFPITSGQYKKIFSKLKKIAKFIKVSHHVDHYFTPIKNSFLNVKYPYEWLTVRKRDSKVLMNYKHWYPENTKYTTHCDEYETEVFDLKQVLMILEALKFKKFITVEKKRKIFMYEDKFEVSMDEVKGLGRFIEIETTKDLGTVEKAHLEILNFTKDLGLKNKRTVPGGYAAALMRKKGISFRI